MINIPIDQQFGNSGVILTWHHHSFLGRAVANAPPCWSMPFDLQGEAKWCDLRPKHGTQKNTCWMLFQELDIGDLLTSIDIWHLILSGASLMYSQCSTPRGCDAMRPLPPGARAVGNHGRCRRGWMVTAGADKILKVIFKQHQYLMACDPCKHGRIMQACRLNRRFAYVISKAWNSCCVCIHMCVCFDNRTSTQISHDISMYLSYFAETTFNIGNLMLSVVRVWQGVPCNVTWRRSNHVVGRGEV